MPSISLLTPLSTASSYNIPMQTSIQHIELLDLTWILIPVGVVYGLYLRWSDDRSTIPYALVRMFGQLILIGYVLAWLFGVTSAWWVVGALGVMLTAAGIIALRPMRHAGRRLYLYAFVSIAVGGLLTLAIVVAGVLHPDRWWEPKFLIPLAGMIFANAMNALSIAAERFESERAQGNGYVPARAAAYRAALIPIINSLFAVGLVSLPGMMTGQILSNVDPLIAVRYQIMVMLMILSSAGISVAIFLRLLKT